MEDNLSTDAFAIQPRQFGERLEIIQYKDSEQELHSGSPSDNNFGGSAVVQERQQNVIGTDLKGPNVGSPIERSKNEINESTPKFHDVKEAHQYESEENRHLKQEEQNHYLHPSDVNSSEASQPDVPSISPSEKKSKGLDSSQGAQGEIEVNSMKKLCLPTEPPLDWRLYELLLHIASNVDEEEIERIKLLFTGHRGIGKKVLEECKTCIALFTVLKQRGYISRDNILYLNKILYTLERKDLIKKTTEYCREENDGMCYYSMDEQPGLDRKQIKIHVKGDVKDYNRGQLEDLHNVTARIVCVPVEEIEITAVEPGSGLLITFTMPKMYVDILKDLLEERVSFRRLKAMDVDIIIVDSIHYDVTGSYTMVKESQQFKEIMNVYQQLEAKRDELEKMEIINLNCQKELSIAKYQLEKIASLENANESLAREKSVLTAKCSVLQTITVTHFVTESDLENFELLMQEAHSKGQDTELIKQIIKANTEIVTGYHQRRNSLVNREKEIKIQKEKVIDSQLRHKLASGVAVAEEILVEKYGQFLKDYNLSLNQTTTGALKRLSKMISGEKRMTLIKLHPWSKNDVIKSCIDSDEKLLLLGLELKEATTANKLIQLDEMLDRFERLIGSDLKSMFKSMLNDGFNQQFVRQLEQNSKTPEEIVYLFVQSIVFGNVKISHSLSRSIIQKGKGLYHFLNESDKMELSSVFGLQNDEALRLCTEKEKRLLIPCIIFSEMNRLKSVVNPEMILLDMESRLKRRDLVMLYRQLKDTEEEQLNQVKDLEDMRLKEQMLLQDLKHKRKTAEEVLKSKLTNFTLKLVCNVDLGPNFQALTNLLREISTQFSESESKKLLQQCKWGVNDVIEACIQTDGTLLVQGLWQKEIENVQAIPNKGQFILSVCKEVDRVDIFNLYREREVLLLVNDKLVYHMMDKVVEYIETHQAFNNLVETIATI